MLSTADRLRGFTESVIRQMTRVAHQYGAINLSQGFPDFDPPAELLAAAAEALRGGFHRYAITSGSLEFRQALAEKQSRLMGLEIDPDAHLVATCGGTEAMLVALMTVCDPGDSVIIFSPFYENYGADTILAGAHPIYVPLRPPRFDFDRDELRRAFSGGRRRLYCAIRQTRPGRYLRQKSSLLSGIWPSRQTPLSLLTKFTSISSTRRIGTPTRLRFRDCSNAL